MGCVQPQNGNVVDDSHEEEEPRRIPNEKVNEQRRRLSVTPALVGDIDGVRVNPADRVKSPRRLSLGIAPDDSEIGLKDLGLAEQEEAFDRIANEHVAVTKKGFVPYNQGKKNQDSYILKTSLFGDDSIDLFGVCDGHGEFGHHISAFVREKYPEILQDMGKAAVLENVSESLKSAVHILSQRLAESKINTTFSGTTAVFALKHNSTLWVANIGDSRCIIVSEKANQITTKALSWDQKPEVESERQRILDNGGRVATLPGAPGEDLGPLRVWLSDIDVPGLAMSRSIGDQVSHTVGVISTPEIKQHEIGEDDLFVIWASDGVWEFISNEEAAEIVFKCLPDIEAAAKTLVLESESRWKIHETVVDDITCVILFLRDLEAIPME